MGEWNSSALPVLPAALHYGCRAGSCWNSSELPFGYRRFGIASATETIDGALSVRLEARNHAACDVDGERQPRPPQRPSILAVDDNDIDQRVIDLDNLKCALGGVLPGNRSETVT